MRHKRRLYSMLTRLFVYHTAEDPFAFPAGPACLNSDYSCRADSPCPARLSTLTVMIHPAMSFRKRWSGSAVPERMTFMKPLFLPRLANAGICSTSGIPQVNTYGMGSGEARRTGTRRVPFNMPIFTARRLLRCLPGVQTRWSIRFTPRATIRGRFKALQTSLHTCKSLA